MKRITLEDVEAEVAETHYFTAAAGVFGAQGLAGNALSLIKLGRVTFCVMVMKNGHMLVGHSTCADSAWFDAQIGRDVARKKALEQGVELLYYAQRG